MLRGNRWARGPVNGRRDGATVHSRPPLILSAACSWPYSACWLWLTALEDERHLRSNAATSATASATSVFGVAVARDIRNHSSKFPTVATQSVQFSFANRASASHDFILPLVCHLTSLPCATLRLHRPVRLSHPVHLSRWRWPRPKWTARWP